LLAGGKPDDVALLAYTSGTTGAQKAAMLSHRNLLAEAAGVTKRTLYYHFASKDDLIAAYLEERDLPTLGRYQGVIPEGGAPAARPIRRIFEQRRKNAEHPRWLSTKRKCSRVQMMSGYRAIVLQKSAQTTLRATIESARPGY